eukprot:COSAG02_NODE_21401_length_789_cov_1.566667_1_plen_22_part_10
MEADSGDFDTTREFQPTGDRGT